MEEMQYILIETVGNAEIKIQEDDIALFYFSAERCNVCKALMPKVTEMALQYPEMKLYYVDVEKNQEFSGKYSIFTIPVIVVFIQGKETIRASRNISVPLLEDKIERYYHLLYNQ